MLLLEQDYIDVTWKMSYSGRTPLKHQLLELNDLLLPKKINMSESEHLKALKQDSAEMYCMATSHP